MRAAFGATSIVGKPLVSLKRTSRVTEKPHPSGIWTNEVTEKPHPSGIWTKEVTEKPHPSAKRTVRPPGKALSWYNQLSPSVKSDPPPAP